MAKPNAAAIAVKDEATFIEPLLATSKGLPPPDESPGVGSGEPAVVAVLDKLDDVLVGEEDC